MKFLQRIKEKYWSDEKNRAVTKNVIGAFLVKGTGLLFSLVTMPAYMKYFENEAVLGLWFTILSVLTWIMNFDLGIGNGLRNNLVKAIELNDRKQMKHYISSAYVVIGIISAVLLAILMAVFQFVNWNAVFNITKDVISPEKLLLAIRMTFLGIMLQFFLRLINSILYALQKSAINNLISLISQAVILSFVLLYPSNGGYEANLIALSVAHILATNIPLIIVTIIIFVTKLKDCLPNPKFYGASYAKGILAIGGIFLICQLLHMLLMNTNELFITQLINPEAVVEYQIYLRLFSLAGTLFNLALTPIWSAVTKSVAQKDFLWLKKVFKTLKILSLIAVAAQFLIVPLLPFILKIWLGSGAVEVNYVYALLFAAFGGIFVYHNSLSTVVCGTGRMKLQLFSYLIGFLCRVGIIVLGMKLFHSWIVVVVANAIVLLPYCILQDISLTKYINKNLLLPQGESTDVPE